MYLPKSVAVFAIAGAAAQGMGNISQECKSTLAGIATNPDAAACLNSGGLFGFLNAGDNSIVGATDSWLSGLCGSPACSNETLAVVVSNLTTGCSTDLQSYTGVTVSNETAVQQVQTFYPTVRKIACLKDNNTLCVTETLTDLENQYGTLTLSNAVQLVSKLFYGKDIPQNITCSNCTKAAYNIVGMDFPQYLTEDVNSTLTDTCGSNFTDGQTPSGINQSANTSPPVNRNSENSDVHAVITSGTLLLAFFGTVVGLL